MVWNLWCDSLHQRAKINTVRSTSRLQRSVRRCLIVSRPYGCKALSRKKHFWSFMSLGNYWMHATMFNTFAPDVLNYLQNKKMCTCTAHQLQILVYIPKHWAQYTLQFKMWVYAIRSAADNAVSTLLLVWLHTFCFFTSIRFIWWMPQPNDA